MLGQVRKFIFNLLIITLILTCVGYGLFYFFFQTSYFRFFPVIPIVLFSVTLGAHMYLVKASAGDPGKFISKYLGAMGLKIMLYLVFIIVVLALDRTSAIPFLVSFLAMYAVLTLFEVSSILRTLKNRS
jgi:hypothetical protein